MTASPLSSPHLNPNVLGLPPSATLAINERSDALIADGRKVYKLGLGQSPFPVPQCVVAALREAAAEKDYLPVRGLRPLREMVTEFLHRRHGLERARRQVLVGPGSKELIFLTQLAYAGELLVPSPSWVSYAPQARIIGRRVTWLQTDFAHDWKLLPQTLDAHCRANPGLPRLLIVNYPNNPTGVVCSDAELAMLAEVARRHQVLVISDEIYSDLDHSGRAASIAHHYPEGTVVSTGLSKWCGAGGWRLGLFSFPAELEWLCSALASIASETYTSVSAPIQHAALRAFAGGPEIEAMRKKQPYYANVQLPANTYKGQTAPVDTLAVMAVWATHDGLSDQMAYEVTKALFENTETLGQVHPKGKEISLKTALQSVSIPLHPGAEKYYREKGLIK